MENKIHLKYPSTYNSWNHMKQRCYNPKNKDFSRYGGKGITVCDRWKGSFKAFLEDMGARPKGTSIDRIDNNKGYEPTNCRWTDSITQKRNMSRVKLNVELAAYIKAYYNQGGNIASLSRRLNINEATIRNVCQGITWKDVKADTSIVIQPEDKLHKTKRASLTPSNVVVIRYLLERNIKRKEIANLYKVETSTISAIKAKRSWGHVKERSKPIFCYCKTWAELLLVYGS